MNKPYGDIKWPEAISPEDVPAQNGFRQGSSHKRREARRQKAECHSGDCAGHFLYAQRYVNFDSVVELVPEEIPETFESVEGEELDRCPTALRAEYRQEMEGTEIMEQDMRAVERQIIALRRLLEAGIFDSSDYERDVQRVLGNPMCSSATPAAEDWRWWVMSKTPSLMFSKHLAAGCGTRIRHAM